MKVAFVSSRFGTPRHRCLHPQEQLRHQGIEAEFLEEEAPRLSGFTHAVLNRAPLTPALAHSIADADAAGTTVLFDVDDLLFDPELVGSLEFVQARTEADRARLLEAVGGIAATIARCRSGLCATRTLRSELEARGFGAQVALNGVSDEMVRLSDEASSQRKAEPGVVRVGFASAHPGHAFNIPIAAGALAAVLQRFPHVRLVFMGAIDPPAQLAPWADRIERVPYMDWRRLPFELARLDVAIAPLEDNPFNRCKSDVKFLDAALVRVPLVASPVGQVAETVRHGMNGMLAAGTDAWTDALETLIEDCRLRAELGEAARDYVLRERTSAALGAGLAGALRAAAADPAPAGAPGPAWRRREWQRGPEANVAKGWLALEDDELLYRIEALPAGHDQDQALMDVVRSNRHFFVRQEAAKKIGDGELLKSCAGDRHIGQVLVRVMRRAEDITYLERLCEETRHLEVRKAAEAQLGIIRAARASRGTEGT